MPHLQPPTLSLSRTRPPLGARAPADARALLRRAPGRGLPRTRDVRDLHQRRLQRRLRDLPARRRSGRHHLGASAGDARALVGRARHHAVGRRLSRGDERRRRGRGAAREASRREQARRRRPAVAGADRILRRHSRQFLGGAHRGGAEGAVGGHLRRVQPPDAGQERRGAGAGALRRARRRSRLQGDCRGDGAGRRRGGGVRRGRRARCCATASGSATR